MKNIIFLSLLLFPLLSYSAGTMLDNKDISSSVVEASSFLKGEITREIKQSVGLEEFVISVELKVDERQLKKSLGVNEEDWRKLQDMQLPGLFVEGKEGYASSSLKQARKEDILLSLSAIKVNIIFYEDNYSPEFLTSALKKIVMFNIPNLKENQIDVIPTKENAPYRKSDKAVTVNVNPTAAQTFWDKFHKPIIAGSILLLLALGYFFTNTLKGSFSSLSEVIKTKTFSSSGGSAPTASAKQEVQASSYRGAGDQGTDVFESYMQANEHLAQMTLKEAKVFNEVIILKLMAEDFVSLTILLDVLPKEKREMFLGNMDAEKKERFKSFIVGQGTSVLKDENLLKAEAIKMIKLVKVASMSPDELYQIVITDMISALNTADLGGLLKSSTIEEKAFMCEFLDSNQLAFQVQSDNLAPADIEADFPSPTKSEMVDLLIKASSVRGFQKTKIKKDKLESVYAQVETDKAEVLADAMGLEPHLRFEFLFTTFKEPALKYLETMNFESLALLFPLMTKSMRDEVLAQLPELLAERLKFAKKHINADSLKLKGDFYFYLRSLSNVEESADPVIRLAA